MKLLERFDFSRSEEYHSPLSPAEVLAVLRPMVAATPVGMWAASTSVRPYHLFWGKLATDSFTIWRGSVYRNGKGPFINGYVQPDLNGAGSVVRLRYGWASSVLALTKVWLTIVGAISVFMLVKWLLTSSFPAPLLTSLGLLTAGILSITGPLWHMVRQSRPLLVRQLRLEAVGPTA